MSTPDSSAAARDAALSVVRTLVDGGHVAYFAGGCVRDALLGREPKDYDVATSARPDDVRGLFRRAQGVGQAFGVVLVRVGAAQVEVATFRADGAYSDGRRPDDVRFAGEIEDAQRRDFTINGLFFDPLGDRIIDYVGGRADLANGILRAIGDPAARFAEDYLRLLRAIRFAARLGFSLHPSTRAAIVANASKLARIAPERIAAELRIMFVAPSRAAAASLLDDVQLTAVLLRGLAHAPRLQPSDRLVRRLGANTSFPLALVAFALAATAAEVGEALRPAVARAIEAELRRTLKLSNDEMAAARTILGIGPLLASPAMPSVSTLKRYLAQPYAADGRQLLVALADDTPATDRVAELERAMADALRGDVAPPPLVTGDDLAAMGFPPGPRFKVALDAAYDAQLEGRVTSPDEARALARARMS